MRLISLTVALLLSRALASSASLDPSGEVVVMAEYPYTLPTLPYAYNALEPHIDEATMKVHHTGHHQVYTDKLNGGIEALRKEAPALAALPLDELLQRLAEIPEKIRPVIRNHGGGYVNHKLFFCDFMAPPGQGDNKPTGALAAAIDASFGSFDKMKEDFSNSAATVFGSGWAWLVVDKAAGNALKVAATSNQDTPAMQAATVPILGLDVWEHAYYLKYQNKRVAYINAWWSVVNWSAVTAKYEKAIKA